MFNNKEQKQLEFFEEIANSSAKNKRFGLSVKGEGGRDFRISYEKIILVVIVFILSLTLVFSWGVECGKGLKQNVSSREMLNPLEISEKKEDNTILKEANPLLKEEKRQDKKIKLAVENKTVAKKAEVKIAQSPQDKVLKDVFYTVQVVTYKDKEKAKSEKGIIEKSGLQAFVVKSGKYFLVCAGSFNEISAAQNKLPSLRKKYKDCFVKKIKKSEIYFN